MSIAEVIAERLAEQLGGEPSNYVTCAQAIAEDVDDSLGHIDPVEVALGGIDYVRAYLRGIA